MAPMCWTGWMLLNQQSNIAQYWLYIIVIDDNPFLVCIIMLKMDVSIIAMTVAPRKDLATLIRWDLSIDANIKSRYTIMILNNPHTTLTGAVESPSLGCFANGVGNLLPQIPITKWYCVTEEKSGR